MRVAIEVKATARVTGDDLRGLRHLVVDHPPGLGEGSWYAATKPRCIDDGIEILPATELVDQLASGELFGDG
jgi:hypothetical protein